MTLSGFFAYFHLQSLTLLSNDDNYWFRTHKYCKYRKNINNYVKVRLMKKTAYKSAFNVIEQIRLQTLYL